MTRLTLHPPRVTDDELADLIERARNAPPMTAAELRAQRISFAYGQLMDCAPEITREQVEEAHDRIYGKGE